MNELSTRSASEAFDKADQAIDNAFALAIGEPTSADTLAIELTQQAINGSTIEAVSARELHAFLENGDHFASWIKDRIEKYEFVENYDYVSFSVNSEKPQGGRPTTEYYITLDMAKQLSMVERNDKGRQARRYFIECEHKLKEASKHTVPQTFVEALKLAYEQQLVIEQQQAQISVMQPKSEYFDMLVERNHVTSFTDTAKQIGVGVHQFTNFLLDKGYCYRQQTTGKKKGMIKPCVEHTHLFEIKDFSVTNTQTDKTYSNVQTLVSPDGKSLFMALKDLILTYPKKSMF